ncbi:MAG: hypothetical protein NTU90_01895, partial [Proteobacteria bacterium]|nr:hypothetical protein [Pseudomonadota bacterium]
MAKVHHVIVYSIFGDLHFHSDEKAVFPHAEAICNFIGWKKLFFVTQVGKKGSDEMATKMAGGFDGWKRVFR